MDVLITILASGAFALALLYFTYSAMSQLKKLREYSHMQTILLKKILQKQGEDVSLDELNKLAKDYVSKN